MRISRLFTCFFLKFQPDNPALFRNKSLNESPESCFIGSCEFDYLVNLEMSQIVVLEWVSIICDIMRSILQNLFRIQRSRQTA